LKATKSKGPAAFDLAVELRKEGPKLLLQEGGSYVLVSSQDLNPAQRARLEQAVAAEAAAVFAELGVVDYSPKTEVWDAQTLAGLCQLHPAPAAAIGLMEFGAALSLEELLETLRASERPFQSDEARENAIDRLRERALPTTEDPLLLWLHGD